MYQVLFRCESCGEKYSTNEKKRVYLFESVEEVFEHMLEEFISYGKKCRVVPFITSIIRD